MADYDTVGPAHRGEDGLVPVYNRKAGGWRRMHAVDAREALKQWPEDWTLSPESGAGSPPGPEGLPTPKPVLATSGKVIPPEETPPPAAPAEEPEEEKKKGK